MNVDYKLVWEDFDAYKHIFSYIKKNM